MANKSDDSKKRKASPLSHLGSSMDKRHELIEQALSGAQKGREQPKPAAYRAPTNVSQPTNQTGELKRPTLMELRRLNELRRWIRPEELGTEQQATAKTPASADPANCAPGSIEPKKYLQPPPSVWSKLDDKTQEVAMAASETKTVAMSVQQPQAPEPLIAPAPGPHIASAPGPQIAAAPPFMAPPQLAKPEESEEPKPRKKKRSSIEFTRPVLPQTEASSVNPAEMPPPAGQSKAVVPVEQRKEVEPAGQSKAVVPVEQRKEVEPAGQSKAVVPVEPRKEVEPVERRIEVDKTAHVEKPAQVRESHPPAQIPPRVSVLVEADEDEFALYDEDSESCADEFDPQANEFAAGMKAQSEENKTQLLRIPEEGLVKSRRGTIEMVVQRNGRVLTPFYNAVGVMKAVSTSDGIIFKMKADGKTWGMVDGTGKRLNSQPIISVNFDKKGNLIYQFEDGARTIMHLDGSTTSD